MRSVFYILLLLVLAACPDPFAAEKQEKKEAKPDNWQSPPEDGHFKGYYDGILISEGNYRNGRPDGKWQYYTNTNTRIEANYLNGRKHGEWKYNRNGEHVSTLQYRSGVLVKKENMQQEEELTVTEEMPVFVDGDVNRYIMKNIVYPAAAKDMGIQGSVYIEFTVDEAGEVNDVKVARGVEDGELLEQEAMRVISAMPRWFPGLQEKKPVRVKYTMPIKFTLK